MKYFYLGAAVFCTFVALLDFKGRPMDALIAAFAVFDFGMFLSA